MKVYIRYINIC